MAASASPSAIKRNLKREVSRLYHHIDHISDEHLGVLAGIAEELSTLHTNDIACKAACTKAGKQYVPWGTKYASPLERTWRMLFPAS